jgi:phage-related protein
LTIRYSSRFYEDDNGTMPVQEYLETLNQMERAKLRKIRDDYLAVYGPRTPDSVMHRVNEFDHQTFGKHRVLCKLVRNEYILLHAFRKQGQKTKDTDIQTAIRRWQQEQKRLRTSELK